MILPPPVYPAPRREFELRKAPHTACARRGSNMSKLRGMMRQATGKLTGDLVLEREGRLEREGKPFRHIDSVGDRVEAVLDHRLDADDDRFVPADPDPRTGRRVS